MTTFREKALIHFQDALGAQYQKFIEQFTQELSSEYGIDVPEKISLVFESDDVIFTFLGGTKTGVQVKCFECGRQRYGVCGSQYQLGRILGLSCDYNCSETWKKWDINDYPDAP